MWDTDYPDWDFPISLTDFGWGGGGIDLSCRINLIYCNYPYWYLCDVFRAMEMRAKSFNAKNPL